MSGLILLLVASIVSNSYLPNKWCFVIDQDGFIDDNEFRTIAAMVRGKLLTPESIKEYKDCAFPVLRVNSTTRREDFWDIEETQVIKALPTIENVLNCSVIREALIKRTKEGSNYQIVPPSHTLADELDVAFEMLYDNATLTEEKLDSIRWRKTKVNIELHASKRLSINEIFAHAIHRVFIHSFIDHLYTYTYLA